MGLKDSELHWLVNHLGHSEKIHLQNYRATSGMIKRIDIAKLMLIQEKNMVGRFAGLKLNEINFEGWFPYILVEHRCMYIHIDT